MRILFLSVAMAAAILTWRAAHAQNAEPAPAPQEQTTAGGLTISTTAFGHQTREDDWPAIAAAPDGSLWAAWLSFNGEHDDIALRHFAAGKWSNIHWAPNTSGDSWMPQVAVDSANRVWVIWTQQLDGNWDLYARRFDPAAQEWGELQRLTSSPLPDINPRLASNSQGRFALVWQGVRGRNSNIFVKTFDGERWSAETRVTNHAANDWDPAVALDSQGSPWIVYDSYRAGNYDVFLWHAGQEQAVAATPRFEARATVAVDSADRVWVAWESGAVNWGKDQGYIIRERKNGATLGGFREAHIRQMAPAPQPAQTLRPVFRSDRVFHPHVFARGSDVFGLGTL